MNINDLDKQFAIKDQLNIVEGKGGFPFIEIKNKAATALISLYGGQLLSYKKAQLTDLFFLSELALYKEGKAIKGGVPVCWPWFGADPVNQAGPAHGFARNKMWQIKATEALSDTKTKVVMVLTNDTGTMQLWPHEFVLSLEIIISDTVAITLITHNTGKQAITISQALHTYFTVADISAVSLKGLQGRTYLDKAKTRQGEEQKTQSGDVTFNGEVDRIYLDPPATLSLEDKAQYRTVKISSKGNKTAVVWNPWQEICQSMGDLQDDDYKRLVCVETANAADDLVTIQAGEKFSLMASYSIE